ncbi:MAG: hypothetical protein JOY81_11750 [Alphaproteobacteria bacterium]|nr:hypothetical protein [Alphaproteobacteria bacterium]
MVTYLPRAVALAAQSRQRDYALQYKELTSRLRPGDQVWGTAIAWDAVVKAGARIDAEPESVPLLWTTKPDPSKHRFVVVPAGRSFENAGFRKIGDYGEALPTILGSTYSSHDYRYELWASNQLDPAK